MAYTSGQIQFSVFSSSCSGAVLIELFQLFLKAYADNKSWVQLLLIRSLTGGMFQCFRHRPNVSDIFQKTLGRKQSTCFLHFLLNSNPPHFLEVAQLCCSVDKRNSCKWTERSWICPENCRYLPHCQAQPKILGAAIKRTAGLCLQQAVAAPFQEP